MSSVPPPPPPPRHPRERPCASEKWRRRKTGSRGADKSRHLPLFLSRHAERGRPPATGTCHGFWELLLGGSAREKTEVSGRCPLGVRGVSGAGGPGPASRTGLLSRKPFHWPEGAALRATGTQARWGQLGCASPGSLQPSGLLGCRGPCPWALPLPLSNLTPA